MSNGVNFRKLAVDLRSQLSAAEKERDTLRAMLTERDSLLKWASDVLEVLGKGEIVRKRIAALSTASPATIVEILQHKGSGEWHVCTLNERIWRGVNDMWFKKKRDAIKWANENGYAIASPATINQQGEGES